jgi:hypothetical protein
MLQSQPVKTYRVTWDELMRHRDEIAPDAVLEVRVFAPETPPAVDAENQALIDLLRSWDEEDANDDPAELERRDAENAELMANLHANRLSLREPEV